MASHMTKLMRRLVNAEIDPWFEVWVHGNQYEACVFASKGTGSVISTGDTPEAAITKAVDDAIAARRK